MLFAAETPWVWDAETNFARLKEQNSNLYHTKSRDIEDKTSISIEHNEEKSGLSLA